MTEIEIAIEIGIEIETEIADTIGTTGIADAATRLNEIGTFMETPAATPAAGSFFVLG